MSDRLPVRCPALQHPTLDAGASPTGCIGGPHHDHKSRIHDATIGVVVTAGVALGYYVDPLWLLVPAVIGSRSLFEIDMEACPHWGGTLKIIEGYRRHRTSSRDRQDPCMFVFNDFYILLFGRGRPLDPWERQARG